MHTQLESRRRFDIRVLFFYAMLVIFLAVLAAHILHLQWVEHQKLALQADRNRINVVPLLPVRGEIIDSKGRPLAMNRIAYQVIMIPERVENIDSSLQQLAAALQWSERKLAQIRKRVRHSRPDRPVLLDDKLQWDVIAPIAARLHHQSGIDVQAGTYRYYPYDDAMSHLIGYLSLARSRDVQAGYLSTEFIGRTGIEHSFESTLHGRLGTQQEEVDAHGRRISVLKRTAPVMGEQLQLTVNANIQLAASRALGSRTGAVVVLDVETGAVLALLSKPGYNTNRFITGLETEQWQAWLNDKRKPLLNRATQAAYPPASTFKLVSGLAGLRQRAALATGTTTCEGAVELADRK
ncbi:MAG: penicillin-binding transpeptidase domain-containing protein, partial [Mariprofundaceae bacterium]